MQTLVWRMRTRTLTLAGILALAGVLASAPSLALNVLSLTPDQPSVLVGNPISFDLDMNFDDETVGGGITVTFDPTLLSLTSVTFDDTFDDDPTFRCPTANLPGSIDCSLVSDDPAFIAFGDFGGLSGALSVATLVFDTLDVGLATVGATVTNPFGSLTGALPVSIGSGDVEIVPEPGTLMLLLVGTGGLAAFGRSRRA